MSPPYRNLHNFDTKLDLNVPQNHLSFIPGCFQFTDSSDSFYFDPNSFVYDLTSVPVLELAKQIVLLDWKIFKELTLDDFLRAAWDQKSKKSLNSGIGKLTTQFNVISFWVIDEILKITAVKRRANCISYFIKLAKNLHSLNDLHSEFAVLSALQSASIYRLQATWNLVPKKHKGQLEKMLKLFSDQDNYSSYRSYMNALKLPCIPYTGIFMTDLVYIYQVKDYVSHSPNRTQPYSFTTPRKSGNDDDHHDNNNIHEVDDLRGDPFKNLRSIKEPFRTLGKRLRNGGPSALVDNVGPVDESNRLLPKGTNKIGSTSGVVESVNNHLPSITSRTRQSQIDHVLRIISECQTSNYETVITPLPIVIDYLKALFSRHLNYGRGQSYRKSNQPDGPHTPTTDRGDRDGISSTPPKYDYRLNYHNDPNDQAHQRTTSNLALSSRLLAKSYKSLTGSAVKRASGVGGCARNVYKQLENDFYKRSLFLEPQHKRSETSLNASLNDDTCSDLSNTEETSKESLENTGSTDNLSNGLTPSPLLFTPLIPNSSISIYENVPFPNTKSGSALSYAGIYRSTTTTTSKAPKTAHPFRDVIEEFKSRKSMIGDGDSVSVKPLESDPIDVDELYVNASTLRRSNARPRDRPVSTPPVYLKRGATKSPQVKDLLQPFHLINTNTSGDQISSPPGFDKPTATNLNINLNQRSPMEDVNLGSGIVLDSCHLEKVTNSTAKVRLTDNQSQLYITPGDRRHTADVFSCCKDVAKDVVSTAILNLPSPGFSRREQTEPRYPNFVDYAPAIDLNLYDRNLNLFSDLSSCVNTPLNQEPYLSDYFANHTNHDNSLTLLRYPKTGQRTALYPNYHAPPTRHTNAWASSLPRRNTDCDRFGTPVNGSSSSSPPLIDWVQRRSSDRDAASIDSLERNNGANLVGMFDDLARLKRNFCANLDSLSSFDASYPSRGSDTGTDCKMGTLTKILNTSVVRKNVGSSTFGSVNGNGGGTGKGKLARVLPDRLANWMSSYFVHDVEPIVKNCFFRDLGAASAVAAVDSSREKVAFKSFGVKATLDLNDQDNHDDDTVSNRSLLTDKYCTFDPHQYRPNHFTEYDYISPTLNHYLPNSGGNDDGVTRGYPTTPNYPRSHIPRQSAHQDDYYDDHYEDDSRAGIIPPLYYLPQPDYPSDATTEQFYVNAGQLHSQPSLSDPDPALPDSSFISPYPDSISVVHERVNILGFGGSCSYFSPPNTCSSPDSKNNFLPLDTYTTLTPANGGTLPGRPPKTTQATNHVAPPLPPSFMLRDDWEIRVIQFARRTNGEALDILNNQLIASNHVWIVYSVELQPNQMTMDKKPNGHYDRCHGKEHANNGSSVTYNFNDKSEGFVYHSNIKFADLFNYVPGNQLAYLLCDKPIVNTWVLVHKTKGTFYIFFNPNIQICNEWKRRLTQIFQI